MVQEKISKIEVYGVAYHLEMDQKLVLKPMYSLRPRKDVILTF